MRKTLNTYFKLVSNKSGIAVKEFTTLLDAFNHIRNTINEPRDWSVEEKSLDDGKFICGISAFYLIENFKDGVGLPESIQDTESKYSNMVRNGIKIYTKENKRHSIGSYTKGNGEHECAIRDGVYYKPSDDSHKKDYHDEAYIVDFYGNIFYNEKSGAEFKMVADEQFIKAKKDGFYCIRNLTDNEIFAMKDVIDEITSIHNSEHA